MHEFYPFVIKIINFSTAEKVKKDMIFTLKYNLIPPKIQKLDHKITHMNQSLNWNPIYHQIQF